MTAFHTPLTLFRRQSATDGTVAPQNASGLTLGANDSAVTASQEYYVYQVAAAAGNQPFYEVGVGGTAYTPGGNINIPNPGVASAQSIATIPAGSRLQNINMNLLQAPTGITGGSFTASINGTAIGTFTVGVNTGNASIAWATTVAALRLVAYVGASDAVLTISLAGTGITGGILAEFSIQFTGKRGDGSILAQGGAADGGIE